MARKLRIQYPGALYHVINRGNYQRAVFETAGAARAFEAALAEACERHRWRIHAYATLPNHFHFALETPEANLVDGMHWLQSTFATRFNRFRAKRGHLFQGRYQALLVEDSAALLRVVNYINLNPVRAGLVESSGVATYRWGSLRRFVQGARAPWLVGDAILRALGLADLAAGWASYLGYLTTLASDTELQQQQGFDEMCRGWAIGTSSWRREMAQQYAHLALNPGYEAEELREIKESRWRAELERALSARGLSLTEDLKDASADTAQWKIEVALQLRREVAAPYRWMAEALKIRNPASLRMQVHRLALHVSA